MFHLLSASLGMCFGWLHAAHKRVALTQGFIRYTLLSAGASFGYMKFVAWAHQNQSKLILTGDFNQDFKIYSLMYGGATGATWGLLTKSK